MKAIFLILITVAASGCSALREKPYQASDTTASGSSGPTQRSTQRMFNPDGSLGIYFGT
jgi:hypothetical protein